MTAVLGTINNKISGKKGANLCKIMSSISSDNKLIVPKGKVILKNEIAAWDENFVDFRSENLIINRNHFCEELLGGYFTDSEYLIVRSSAVGEDSSQASFAGQLLSKVCAANAVELESIISECINFYKCKVIDQYEQQTGAKIGALELIVQEYVQCDFSGVLFSRDPSNAECIRVEYCVGDCAKLVNGEINPGFFQIDCSSFKLGKNEIISSQFYLDQILSQQVLELILNALKYIETMFENPVDIEWGWNQKSGLYIFQCRDITTNGFTADFEKSAELPKYIFSNSNMSENYPTKVTPLLFSIAKEGYTWYFKNMAELFGLPKSALEKADSDLRSVLGTSEGHLYYNLSSIYSCFMLLPLPKVIIDYWNLFLGIEPATESKSEVNARFLDSIKEYSKIFSLIKFLFCGFLSSLSSNKKIAYFEVRCRELQDCALSASSLNECLFAVQEFRKIRTLEWKNACMGDALTMFSTGILRSSIKYFERSFPNSLKTHHNWQDQILGQLISNVSSLASAAPIEQISKIATSIYSNRRARDLFLDDKFSDSAVLTAIKNSKDLVFLDVANNFYLKNWGCRVSGELMLTEKTWLEAPVLFIGELRKRVLEIFNYGSNETAANNGQPIEESNKYMRSKLFLLKNWRKFALKKIVKFCHYSIKLRERARLGQSMAYGSLRISALKIGDYFASQKLLMFADDILFLELDEIQSVCSGSYLFPDTLIKIVEIRKNAYRIAPDGVSAGRKTIVPICKLMNIISEDVSEAEESGKKFIFSGNGVAPGVAKGVAFVANSFGDAQNIPRNSILITRNTDPGWTPLFGRISGLVIENGGMLCHGAIIARELGIPCVTGIIGAVKNIASGAHVKLDGSKGIVEIYNPLP